MRKKCSLALCHRNGFLWISHPTYSYFKARLFVNRNLEGIKIKLNFKPFTLQELKEEINNMN